MNGRAQALTPREAARFLALTLPQVDELIQNGELEVIEVHGRPCPLAGSVLRAGQRLRARRARLLSVLERELPEPARTYH